ncbi:MAG: PQQ-dependent sugar dehydrogenase [Flavisolibacter sp.]|nr:PQQ-dependent sugar dehydrogenase [Flavisolibacter sp.]MBD0351403.1 PQQ-dependent sugar dehydrogenase [Flavisolibacter sp.]
MNPGVFRFFLFFFLLASINFQCYRMRASKGGGQIQSIPQRTINATDIAVPPGYRIEPVVRDLTFPTAVSFDDAGNLYVIEAGYSYGEVWDEPKLLRIEASGKPTVVARGTRNGPWTGITWYSGAFYIAEGGEMEGGRILRVTKDGTVTPLVSNLPSVGDHHTNGPVIKEGYIYFGQGTATNSGVVGKDNAEFGWLKRKRDFHDIPCKDITLTGNNFTTENVLTDDPNDKATTGAYVPFGTSTTEGQVIKGSLPCTGSVLRIPVGGGNVELVAWGLRNPFGLAIAPDGRLFITENGFDERGSRPVWGTGDVLWEIKEGTWYGWPDFSAGKLLQSDQEEFKAPKKEPLKSLLKNYPNTPPQPAAILGVHSSSNGIDFSHNADFGFSGEAFIAQFGDMAPKAGKLLFPVGYKVIRVNVNTGVIRDFATNKGKRNGPATWLKRGGLERPVSVKFDPAGKALYITDFGIMKITKEGQQPQKGTGVIWKITKV